MAEPKGGRQAMKGGCGIKEGLFPVFRKLTDHFLPINSQLVAPVVPSETELTFSFGASLTACFPEISHFCFTAEVVQICKQILNQLFCLLHCFEIESIYLPTCSCETNIQLFCSSYRL